MSDAKKKFILFLKKKGVYATFRKNIHPTRVRNDIKDGYILPYIIDLSFVWSETKEGDDFWRKISNKWSHCSAKNMSLKDFYRYV